MASSPGRLIAIEGGEGAGKSTQAALLAQAIDADLTREPGGTQLGEEIRAMLLDPGNRELSDRTELMLMLAARAQHLSERIEPVLGSGRHVVVDRFSGSTLAYQGYGRGLPLEEIRAAIEVATNGRWPDLNVLVDVSVDTGAGRRGGGPDRIEAETTAFHERVRAGFRAEAEADPDHWVVVDGSGSPDETAGMVLAVVRSRLLGAGDELG